MSNDNAAAVANPRPIRREFGRGGVGFGGLDIQRQIDAYPTLCGPVTVIRKEEIQVSPQPTYAEYLGRAIAAMRHERGMKRRELAVASGVSYPYVSELENGVKGGSVATIVALASALRVAPSAILMRAEAIAAAQEGR
jgi:DNA-binding Xre family transcriptional regulator